MTEPSRVVKRQRVPRPGRFRLPAFTFYREDLDEILEIIGEGSDPPVEIQSDGYRYSTLDDLAAAVGPRSIHDLMLRGHRLGDESDVRLVCQPDRADIVWPNDLHPVDNLKASRIRDLVRRRPQRVLLRVGGILVLPLVGILAFVQFYALHDLLRTAVFSLASIVAAFGFATWAIRWRERSWSTIYLVRRADRPTFLERNGDKIIVAVLAAVIGALAAKLAGTL